MPGVVSCLEFLFRVVHNRFADFATPILGVDIESGALDVNGIGSASVADQ